MSLAALTWIAHSAHAGNDTTFEVFLEDGRPHQSNRTLQATRGDRVSILVRSDQAVTLHLHGYDRELAVPAGGEAKLQFEANAAGRFPVEAHGGHGHEPLFHLEIRPD